MGVSFRQEFHVARSGQFLETVDNFRSVDFHLFEGDTGDGESHFEFAATVTNHFQDCTVGRQVAFLSYAVDDFLILEVIVIVMVVANIEEAISFQTERLMYLKIKTDCFHNVYLF